MKKLETSHVDGNMALGDSFIGRAVNLVDSIIFCCLLALMVISLIPYGTVDAWWEALFECGVFALTAIWMLTAVLRGSWQLKRLYVLWPMFLITGYIFLQTIPLPGLSFDSGTPLARHTLTIDQYQTHLTAVKALSLTLFAALLLLQVSTANKFRWLIRVVIGIGVASALFGILRQVSQSPSSLNGFGLSFLYYGVGYGQFLSANVFAFLMEMVFGVIAGLVLGGGIRRQHILIYIAGGLLVWVALVMSSSRGGVLGFVCQFIFVAFVSATFYLARRARHDSGDGNQWFNRLASSVVVRIMAMALIVAVLIVGVLWVGGQKLALKESSDESLTGLSRKEIWHSSWELIKHNPSTGVGFGAFYLAIPEYQTGSGRIRVEQAHNDYLDLTASGGVVGIVLAALFLGSILWRVRSSLRTRDSFRKAAALGATAGMLSVAVHSFVDFGLQITGIAVVLMALIVIAVADLKNGESSHLKLMPSARNHPREHLREKMRA